MADRLPIATLATAWMASHVGQEFTSVELADMIDADRRSMNATLKRLLKTGYQGLIQTVPCSGRRPARWVYQPGISQTVPSSALAVPTPGETTLTAGMAAGAREWMDGEAPPLVRGDMLEVLGRIGPGTVLVREATGRMDHIWALRDVREAAE